MKRKPASVSTLGFLGIAVVVAIAQTHVSTLVVSGHSENIPMTQMNGRTYVDLESLARALNGSLTFNNGQTVLSLSGTDPNGTGATRAPTTATQATNLGFSKEFLRAGIEEMSTIREWHSALRSAIENQYALSQEWLSRYQAQAATNLRLAQAAAATDADHSAASLITNEYRKMEQLTNKYIAKRQTLNYISPDALQNDPLDQSIVACGKSLGAMAANGQFTDDGTCH